MKVKKQAEAEGLDKIFVEAGIDWVGAILQTVRFTRLALTGGNLAVPCAWA